MNSENPDIMHFEAIPWCATYLNEPGIVCETTSSRFLKDNGEGLLFATTLNTPSTITALLTLYKPPTPQQRQQRQQKLPSPTSSPLVINEVMFLVSFGLAVGGYPGVCHGGIVATILDEVTSMLFPINRAHGAIPGGVAMTGHLNTKFLRPLKVPASYLCRGCVERVEGRKYFLHGTIEDGDGTILARAEALYIILKENL
ncbi:thioesterase superfamily protein [Dactylonectria macrodidyma]|uniref:Thioesterase superfamily protein n=1 Tax=Dactylonectria macrodidyma TaxID=307937 RepID=A0A9P9JN11_9HYPO|nr:thioesterase superfamily protein [Dactylonectria macrodidyma]